MQHCPLWIPDPILFFLISLKSGSHGAPKLALRVDLAGVEQRTTTFQGFFWVSDPFCFFWSATLFFSSLGKWQPWCTKACPPSRPRWCRAEDYHLPRDFFPPGKLKTELYLFFSPGLFFTHVGQRCM